MNTSLLRKQLDKSLLKRQQAISQIEEEKERLAVASEELETALIAQQCLQKIAQAIQNQAHKQIAQVVSRCLSAVFEEPYELSIDFVQRRGRTEAEFVYVRDGQKINPMVTSGGVLDVVALALRLTAIVLTLPPARRLLCLDEPFLGVSATNMPKMAALIGSLSKELGVQFIIASHSDALKIGKVVEL